MKRLLLILILLPVLVEAQELSVSPTSVPLWGAAPQTAMVSASYQSVEAAYLYGFKTMYDHEDAAFGGGYLGLFWNPLHIRAKRLTFTGGAGYFFRRFPTVNGTHINFTIKATYQVTETIGIRYSHISNGFGAFSSLNPGVDNIGLTIRL